MPRRSATRAAKARDDVAQLAQPAVGGDDADEVAHRLGEAFLFAAPRSAALVAWFTSISGDSSRRRKSALASISPAERLHLGHHGIERVLILGVRIERGGVAVGQAAAGCDRRST